MGLEGRERRQSVPLPVKMKKLSKKEKRFQLSRDDGAYCELSSIDPVTAVRSDSSGNVRLNPIGPAFLASFPGQPESPRAAAVTSHNGPTPSVAGQPNNGEDFLGSYYVLEVGNFKKEEEEETGERGKGGEEEEELPAAYYLLDVAHMDERERGGGERRSRSKKRSDSTRSYENISSPQTIQYENVEPKKSVGPKYENIGMRRCHERQKSSPLGIPQPSGGGGRGEGEGVGDHEDTTMVRRMSTSLPSRSMTGDVARERLIAAAAITTDNQQGKERSLSQNESTPGVEGRLPRSQRSREQIYEMTSVTFPKRCPSQKEADQSTDKKMTNGESAMVNGEVDVTTMTTNTTDSATKEEDEREKVEKERGGGGEGEPLTKMMEPNALPFAGLVISSSSAEVVEEGRAGGMRPRTETIWDDSRVQREWNQVSWPHPLILNLSHTHSYHSPNSSSFTCRLTLC